MNEELRLEVAKLHEELNHSLNELAVEMKKLAESQKDVAERLEEIANSGKTFNSIWK